LLNPQFSTLNPCLTRYAYLVLKENRQCNHNKPADIYVFTCVLKIGVIYFHVHLSCIFGFHVYVFSFLSAGHRVIGPVSPRWKTSGIHWRRPAKGGGPGRGGGGGVPEIDEESVGDRGRSYGAGSGGGERLCATEGGRQNKRRRASQQYAPHCHVLHSCMGASRETPCLYK